jgi:hypothetical protein
VAGGLARRHDHPFATAAQRSLVTIARGEVKQTEIVGFDRILPVLFGRKEGRSG